MVLFLRTSIELCFAKTEHSGPLFLHPKHSGPLEIPFTTTSEVQIEVLSLSHNIFLPPMWVENNWVRCRCNSKITIAIFSLVW
jgi:hypothetical protein